MMNQKREKVVLLDADPTIGSLAADKESREALSIHGLERFGDLQIHQHTSPGEVVQRLAGATIALTNKVPLDRKTLTQLPELRLVSVLATGVNIIDLAAAKDTGVTVCNVPGYSTASTAQHTIALLLELCHHVGSHCRQVREGAWTQSPSFSYWTHPLIELEGLVLGIVGHGAIGRRVAQIGSALGMHILVHTRTPREESGVEFVSKHELLTRSDVVSLHCPLTDQTRHFIDRSALQLMKPSAMLLNCSRGAVVDEHALAEALSARRLRGAGVDVLSEEPPKADHPLLSAERCVVTPHIAWATGAARRRLLTITEQNIQKFLDGSPQNVVS